MAKCDLAHTDGAPWDARIIAGPGKRLSRRQIMNRFIATLANVAVLCLGIALSGTAGAQTVQNHNLLPGQEAPRNIPSAQPTRGVVFLTATINSNGSIAACFGCNAAKTLRLAPGAYQ